MPMGFEFGDAGVLDSVHADPAAFRSQAQSSNIQLTAAIAEANAIGRDLRRDIPALHWEQLSAPNAAVLGEISAPIPNNGRWLRLTNAGHAREMVRPGVLLSRARADTALKLHGD